MHNSPNDLSRAAPERRPRFPGDLPDSLPQAPTRDAPPDAWTRPATAQSRINPQEPLSKRPGVSPIVPLGLVALSLVLALLAVAFVMQV